MPGWIRAACKKGHEADDGGDNTTKGDREVALVYWVESVFGIFFR